MMYKKRLIRSKSDIYFHYPMFQNTLFLQIYINYFVLNSHIQFKKIKINNKI